MRTSGVMDVRTLRKLQRFHAEAIPANAIRNQGAKGVLKAIRTVLTRMYLATLLVETRFAFQDRLNTVTNTMGRRMPKGAQHWGAARKALNLFLRDCIYDYHLRRRYGLAKIEPWLEVPLDTDVAKALRKKPEGRELSGWRGLKGLTESDNLSYQEAAQRVAHRMGLYRVDLVDWGTLDWGTLLTQWNYLPARPAVFEMPEDEMPICPLCWPG